jgi:hypothetical protein
MLYHRLGKIYGVEISCEGDDYRSEDVQSIGGYQGCSDVMRCIRRLFLQFKDLSPDCKGEGPASRCFNYPSSPIRSIKNQVPKYM